MIDLSNIIMMLSPRASSDGGHITIFNRIVTKVSHTFSKEEEKQTNTTDKQNHALSIGR
jgi:hypothetical protein